VASHTALAFSCDIPLRMESKLHTSQFQHGHQEVDNTGNIIRAIRQATTCWVRDCCVWFEWNWRLSNSSRPSLVGCAWRFTSVHKVCFDTHVVQCSLRVFYELRWLTDRALQMLTYLQPCRGDNLRLPKLTRTQ